MVSDRHAVALGLGAVSVSALLLQRAKLRNGGGDGDGGGGGGESKFGIRSGVLVGGGEGYPDVVRRSDADAVARTESDIQSALDASAPGDVVFVPGDVDISIGTLVVPSGVTLASDRGVSAGATLRRGSFDADNDHMVRALDGARVSGLNLVGPYGGPHEPHEGQGVRVFDGEVDNCEISHMGWAAVRCKGSGDHHVHHNFIHDQKADGIGYGVQTEGYVVINANHFNGNRHSVTGGGDESYEVFDNLFGPDAHGQLVDMHGDVIGEPGGDFLHIHHNRCEARRISDDAARNAGDPCWFVLVRGVPMDQCIVEWNWAFNDIIPPTVEPDATWTRAVVLQNFAGSDDWQNMVVRDNHWGPEDPPDV